MEVGIGYLGEANPETINDKPNIKQITLKQVLSEFSRWSTGSSSRGPTDNWLDVTNNDTNQTVRLYAIDFPGTVISHPSGDKAVFSISVPDRNDIVIVATLDVHSWASILQVGDIYFNSMLLLPFILAFSILIGEVISRKITLPLKVVAKTAQRMTGSDLSQRVHTKSNDEIGSLAASFNSMADRLEAAFVTQKQFVSDAAHELRTPLASLKTSVTKAMSAERSSEEYQQLLSFILNRVSTLEDLVNDLLFLARADEGRLGADSGVLDLSPVVLETAESFKDLFEDKGITFTYSIQPDLIIKGSAKLHMRVLSNLLDNAFKYTSEGGTVDLRAVKADSGVEITVRDTGKGMTKDQQAHAFDRFYKSNELPSSEQSFGLGLSITKSIVTAADGEIHVESELGKGTAFRITYRMASEQRPA